MGIKKFYQVSQRYLGKNSKTACLAAIFPILLIICMAEGIFASDSPKNYSILLDLIKLEDKQGPFLALNNFEKSFDKDLHKTNIDFFNQHPHLVKKIKTDLDNQPIQWHLENISYRLLYIPETRETYAATFERYCNDVIEDILKLLELKNPYSKIFTLDGTKPYHSEPKGIQALIVHNLGKEYIAKYIFSNSDQKKIAIQLKGKIFLNEVGSYSSYIHLNENGSFEFTRDPYTIWQNSAENPYTALTTPVEETLHIVLRRYTEKSIKDRIENSSNKTLKEINDVVEDLISVEEAIVGGLVYAMFPSIVQKYFPGLPSSLIESDIETKSAFKKYRHLIKGIKIVEQLGYKNSIQLYQDDPMAFRRLLM